LPGETNEADPTWSPDGNSLLYGSLDQSGTDVRSVAIHLLDLRTHQVSSLPDSEGLFSPRWSPDGHYAVAMSAESQKLMLYDFKTQRWSELATGSVAFPSWSRDGNFVYFDSLVGTNPGIYRVRINNQKVEQIAPMTGLRRAGLVFTWSGLAPDDSPLILRDVGAQDIYAFDWEAP
jgi:Tol biopolymer transport system component